MTTKAMTRNEAESKMYALMKELRDTYYAYNPDGDYISIFVNRNQITIENDFSFSGRDHEHPISVRMYDK